MRAQGLADAFQPRSICGSCQRPALEYDRVCRSCGGGIDRQFDLKWILSQLEILTKNTPLLGETIHAAFSKFPKLANYLAQTINTGYWGVLDDQIDEIKAILTANKASLSKNEADVIEGAFRGMVQQIYKGKAKSAENPFQQTLAEYTQVYRRCEEDHARQDLDKAQQILTDLGNNFTMFESGTQTIIALSDQLANTSGFPTDRPTATHWRLEIEYDLLLSALDPAVLFGFCPSLIAKIRANTNHPKKGRKGGRK